MQSEENCNKKVNIGHSLFEYYYSNFLHILVRQTQSLYKIFKNIKN